MQSKKTSTPNKMHSYTVIGGGIIGASIAYGLTKEKTQVHIIDGADTDLRATRGNFGLIWIQGKGANNPAYADITQQTQKLWSNLAKEMQDLYNVDLGYYRRGGLDFYLDKTELNAGIAELKKLQSHTPDFTYEVWSPDMIKKVYPDIGKDVISALYSTQDAIVNPLYTLRGLWQGVKSNNATITPSTHVIDIITLHDNDGIYYQLTTQNTDTKEQSTFYTRYVIIAAGLHSEKLAKMVGLNIPVRGQKGQIIVTEKLQRNLTIPSVQIRQTAEGGIMMGETHENNADNIDNTAAGLNFMANRAIKIFPYLANANVVRCWGAMRILTPDGSPIYGQNGNAFSVAAHSGITLCAYHVYRLANHIVQHNTLPEEVLPLHGERFNV